MLKQGIAGLSALLVLAGCASTPQGPTVAVMPGPNKPFEVFQQDQILCKDYANTQVTGQAERANQRALGAAAIGTVLGAGLGAAVGGGRGAAIGAGSGAVVGTGIGASNSYDANMSLQQRYDIAYQQCMYSKGNQVPGYYSPSPPPPPPPKRHY
jgi:uncharacterized protein YcfJ